MLSHLVFHHATQTALINNKPVYCSCGLRSYLPSATSNSSIHQLIPDSGSVALGFAQMMNEHVSNFMDQLGAKNNSRKNPSAHVPPVAFCKKTPKKRRFLLWRRGLVQIVAKIECLAGLQKTLLIMTIKR